MVEFHSPKRVLSANDTAAALDTFDTAQAALRNGYWVAGFLYYELGSGFVKWPGRASTPLVCLGIFDAPTPVEPWSAPFSLAPLLPRIDARTYTGAIDTIKSDIYDGEVYQVNYTVPFDLALDGDPLALWHAVGSNSGARYQAFVEHDGGYILSWSPELFLSFDANKVTTKPMKGTAPGSDTGQLNGAKNRAEHVMIVDLLRNDLQRICDAVTVEALCSIEQYPHFVTMTSTIGGELREDASLREIFRATFPCGSVTGAPKRAAFAAIDRLEPFTRDAYCGSVGFLSPERRGWWNVAIRTAQLDRDGRGRYDAGGGIVADSNARDEWSEVVLKTAFLDAFAQPCELLETFASDAAPDVIEEHLARLHAGASLLRIPFDSETARDAMHSAMRRAGHRSLVHARLQNDGRLIVRAEPLLAPELPVRVCIAGARVRSDDPFLRIKSAWRPAHNAAFEEAQARGCFDGLISNERGELTEGSRTNLFVEVDGTLYTPPLAAGLLPGILRSRLVSGGRARERVLKVDDIASADALFLGNSARGLLPARMI